MPTAYNPLPTFLGVSEETAVALPYTQACSHWPVLGVGWCTLPAVSGARLSLPGFLATLPDPLVFSQAHSRLCPRDCLTMA